MYAGESKKCPFCGGGDIGYRSYGTYLRVAGIGMPSDDIDYQIVCMECGAAGPLGKSYAAAEQNWSRRK